jgi:UDP-N-acetylmuramoyl-L-alanyl-D-glutamate--2,6-diaminopimelate ligase
MKLAELIAGIRCRILQGDPETEIPGLSADSRQAGAGSLFVAVSGSAADGHRFIGAAVAAGAGAVLAERFDEGLPEGVACIQAENSRQAWGLMAANLHGNPARSLVMCGVTGTNGKTTVATLLYQLFRRLGYRCGLVSTVSYEIDGERYPSTHTTPDPSQLQRLLAAMRDRGCTHVFMEVSSHALDQERVAGIPYRAALFTNLTHDHLDYHKTFRNYLIAKKKLFDGLGSEAVAIVNLDDRNGQVMVQNTAARVKGYALKQVCDYQGRLLASTLEGLQMRVEGHESWFRLTGEFNAYNLLAVYAAARELGEAPGPVLEAMSLLEGAEGRFQVLRSEDGSRSAVVDYAHTPDALANVLKTLREVLGSPARILTVLGCGGNRDAAKRPEMGRIASTLSDQAIFTSDNPRDEDPDAILDAMMEGVEPARRAQVLVISSRREAIRAACRLAAPGDTLLVAGKGHETYQEIRGVRHPFDDREEVRNAWKEFTENRTGLPGNGGIWTRKSPS